MIKETAKRNKEQFIELLVANLTSGLSRRFYEFMFENMKYWQELSYEDWVNILEEIRNSELALYVYIPFTYKFLGINLIEVYFSLPTTDKNVTTYLSQAITNHYGFLSLWHSELTTLLPFYGLTIASFKDIRDKLISEGALKVEKVQCVNLDTTDWIYF